MMFYEVICDHVCDVIFVSLYVALCHPMSLYHGCPARTRDTFSSLISKKNLWHDENCARGTFFDLKFQRQHLGSDACGTVTSLYNTNKAQQINLAASFSLEGQAWNQERKKNHPEQPEQPKVLRYLCFLTQPGSMSNGFSGAWTGQFKRNIMRHLQYPFFAIGNGLIRLQQECVYADGGNLRFRSS